ncbi:hypothetical protein MD484_g3055, partial [Candolleomyces efflorescens]
MLHKFTAFTVALALLLIQGATVHGAPVENDLTAREPAGFRYNNPTPDSIL